MPELPEVETIKRFLLPKLVGKKIKAIKILSPKNFIGNSKELIGKAIQGLERRAKILIINIEGGKALTVHLKLTGQLVYANKVKEGKMIFSHPLPFISDGELPGKTTRVVIGFIDDSALFFNDMRKFGWMKIVDQSALAELKMGVEPFSQEFTPIKLKQTLSLTKRPVKVALMDQEKIAGVGNIYANEALFEAKINPVRPANSLNNEEIEELYLMLLKVLKEGIKYGGSSDESYIKPDGSSGKYQEHFRVYQRQGEKCFRCQGKIKRIALGGRGTFYCPSCQK